MDRVAFVWRAAVLALVTLLGVVSVPQPAAGADPYTTTDRQYLAALNHGGLCCPEQSDSPVWYGAPSAAIGVGRKVAELMSGQPTYAQFQALRNDIVNVSRSESRSLWGQPLNGYEAGKVIVVAVHYYAGPAVECQLMKQMGGAMGEAPYWYGPVTYSGGLAVQAGCINLDR